MIAAARTRKHRTHEISTGLKVRTALHRRSVTKLALSRLCPVRLAVIMLAGEMATITLAGSEFPSPIHAASGRRRVNEMFDTASAIVQVLAVTMSFGALVMLA